MIFRFPWFRSKTPVPSLGGGTKRFKPVITITVGPRRQEMCQIMVGIPVRMILFSPKAWPRDWGLILLEHLRERLSESAGCSRFLCFMPLSFCFSVMTLTVMDAIMPNSPETQLLLDQARHGDAAAVERLLDEHRGPVRRMIDLRLDPAIGQRLDASDVVQEVLLEASRRLRDYLKKPDMPFHLWLRHIAKDHIIDAHRRHRLAQKRGVDREQALVPAGLADHSSIELAARFIDQELTPASAAIRQEMQRRLHEAIARLDEDDREILLMRHFEQLSNQEAAADLGLTEAAASMRYLRAVRRLRDLFGASGG